MTRQLRKLQNTFLNDQWLKDFRAAKAEMLSLFPPVIRCYKDRVWINYVEESKRLSELLDDVERRYKDKYYAGLVEEIELAGGKM